MFSHLGGKTFFDEDTFQIIVEQMFSHLGIKTFYEDIFQIIVDKTFSHLVEQEEFFPANLEQPNYAAFSTISKPGHQENVAQCVWMQ